MTSSSEYVITGNESVISNYEFDISRCEFVILSYTCNSDISSFESVITGYESVISSYNILFLNSVMNVI